MPEKVLLKDILFNREKVEKIANELARVFPAFEKKKFIAETLSRFPELELKARIDWIAICLQKYLPPDYTEALDIILKSLPPPNDPNLTDDDFGDFIYAPYGAYVAKYGCTKKLLNKSLAALRTITMRFSAEDAIRTFINQFPEETFRTLTRWSTDTNYHVRRLVSEGTRPKLPWSVKIMTPHTNAIPLLNVLFQDTTRYVTRSVANHLNDISKIDPKLVIETLKRWRKSKKQNAKEMEHIVRHALRTLVKRGDQQALALLGVGNASHIEIVDHQIPPTVHLNGVLSFYVEISAQKDSRVVVDYLLSFQHPDQKNVRSKVFKLKTLYLRKDERILLKKQHRLRDDMTTRKLFPGTYELAIQINGSILVRKNFVLLRPLASSIL